MHITPGKSIVAFIAVTCALLIVMSLLAFLAPLLPLLPAIPLVLFTRMATKSARQVLAYRYVRTSAFAWLKDDMGQRVHDHIALVESLRRAEDTNRGDAAFKCPAFADQLAETWVARHPDEAKDSLFPFTHTFQTRQACERALASPADTIVRYFCVTTDDRELEALRSLATTTKSLEETAADLDSERREIVRDVTAYVSNDLPKACVPYVLAELGLTDIGPVSARHPSFLLLNVNEEPPHGLLLKPDSKVLADVAKLILNERYGRTTRPKTQTDTQPQATESTQEKTAQPEHAKHYVHIDTKGDIDPERVVRVMRTYQSQEPVAKYANATIANLDQARRKRDSIEARLDDQFDKGSITYQRYATPVAKTYENILKTAAITANRIQDFDPIAYRELKRAPKGDMTTKVRRKSIQRLLDDLEDKVAHQKTCLLKLERLNDELSKSVSESVEDEIDLEEMDELTEQVKYYR